MLPPSSACRNCQPRCVQLTVVVLCVSLYRARGCVSGVLQEQMVQAQPLKRVKIVKKHRNKFRRFQSDRFMRVPVRSRAALYSLCVGRARG